MALNNKFSNTRAMSIHDLLQAPQVLKVPKFQRNYAWDKEKVTALWTDLMDTFRTVQYKLAHVPEAEYLLGPLVLVSGRNPAEFLVIDGQQRLSTFTLLFCVARDILLEHKCVDGLDNIYNLIENRHMDQRTGWKLELNDIDKKLFHEIQEYESNAEPQWKRLKDKKNLSKSEKYLRDNYLLLYWKIMRALETNFAPEEEIQDGETKADDQKHRQKELVNIRKNNIPMLNYFLSVISQYNFVVMIMVNDDSTAFQIFETLNERGQTLSKSNLIKNHILNQIDKDNTELQQELSDEWNNIFDRITKQGQRDDDFIMESLRSRHFDLQYKSSMKNLYKIIKPMIRNEVECRRYIQELEDDASFLETLNEPSSYRDDATKDEIYALKALNAKFIRTPILTAYRRWKITKNYRTIVRLLVRFFFKFRIVRQMHPGKVEDVLINKVTKMIHDDVSLPKIIDTILANDDHDDFKRDFENKFVADPGKEVAKYTLQQITVHLGTERSTVQLIDNFMLEHILQGPFTAWNKQEFFAEYGTGHKLDEFVSRLGNLTLLDKAIDIKLQDGSFLEKKNGVDDEGKSIGYNKSLLEINKKTVCNNDSWTARTIQQREQEFAVYADTIWSLDSYRN